MLCGPQDWIHCTGAYTEDLPAEGYNPDKPRVRDLWAMGMAQMFATVSHAMFKEFEVDHVAPLFDRFGAPQEALTASAKARPVDLPLFLYAAQADAFDEVALDEGVEGQHR